MRRAPVLIDIALGQTDVARANDRAEHPPVVQAQAGVRRAALAQLQGAAVGQLQMQRAVLQALQQTQGMARIRRQARRQMKWQGSGVHGQWLDEDERETGDAGIGGLVCNGTRLSQSSKAFQRMRAITPRVSRG